MNRQNEILQEIMFEYNLKLRDMENDFKNMIDDFENSDWTETELMAYDLGFSKALLITMDILKEKEMK
jgi:hypothetical protein